MNSTRTSFDKWQNMHFMDALGWAHTWLNHTDGWMLYMQYKDAHPYVDAVRYVASMQSFVDWINDKELICG